ncbi:GTP-binding protein, partial [Yoonia sp.]|uniref:GTP-binding protein n=1 Tax=Yoonia sp. TaxID=2212373 RepID=UPI002FDB2F5E
DPAKVHAVLNGPLPGVIRAKGHFWIATRPDWVAEFSLAGAMSSVTPLGRWWASVPAERLPKHPDAQAEIAAKWAEPWGDRRQEIVFIGADLDREAICAALNAALVTTCDFTPQAWTRLPDPFPQWNAKAA